MSTALTPRRAGGDAKRALIGLARPAGDFDFSRYFRSSRDIGFHNTGTAAMRSLANSIYQAHRHEWSIDSAIAFADLLIVDRYLETKSVGIEVLSRYQRQFTPRLLPVLKRWLAEDYAANWATTDAMCGGLLGPLLVMHPALAGRMAAWSRHRNMWVRRASVVGLIASARRDLAIDILYENAARLHADQEDLIQKAVGWALREAGKRDMPRLERYLRRHGPSIPRTTVRYAIERFSDSKRRSLLVATRSPKVSDGR